MSNSCCRSCSSLLKQVFTDLGKTPLSNSFLKAGDLHKMEPYFPLCAYVCESCLLVQLEEFESPASIFTDYAYFSSYSTSWLRHAESYVQNVTQRFTLNQQTFVVEIASNDGYLLQYFKQRGVPCLGIEPAANVALVAEQKGVPTLVRFFGTETARHLVQEDKQADLIIGNNVYAHVPELNDFTAGLKLLLKPRGRITLEFPHLLRLIEDVQFDTIYHEHFSYFSLHAVEKVLERNGLALFDVEELPTHGGSLRIFVKHANDGSHATTPAVGKLRDKERAAGLDKLASYSTFQARCDRLKDEFVSFLIDSKAKGKKIVGYGAPAKGNTLLNFAGIKKDLLAYTVDRSPHKQGQFLPGTLIPIRSPEHIRETKPDFVVILPWNLKHEIVEQMAEIRSWGGRFVTAVPKLEVF